jgi:hypothetical protein
MEEERRSRSFGRLEPDLPSVLLNQFATKIEAQAGPADALGLTIGDSHKAAKKAGLLGLWNADALILHTEADHLSINFTAQNNLDRPSRRAVFDGIGQQVGEHLLDAPRVSLHYKAGEGCGRRGEGELMARRGSLETCDDAPLLM